MKRSDLLRVFTTEGGLSTRTRRTYVLKQCPTIKVDVEFSISGLPSYQGRQPKMQQPLGPVTCKTCGSEIRIWYEDDGKAIPSYEIICPNGEDHTFALDLPGTFLYAEVVDEE